MNKYLLSSVTAAIAASCLLVSAVQASGGGNEDITTVDPIDRYGIVTDVTIQNFPGAIAHKITWLELECGVEEGQGHVSVGDPVECTTVNPAIIQAATAAALMNGGGNGYVNLEVVRGRCISIAPTKKYNNRYECVDD
ncbi:MAG: hypothetical protein AADX96_03850 [Thiocapsa sp. C3-sup]|uniref:hypothetical protein n=1 Tax=unclassified Thiocapsa TaxID=2641286 RepID=UPI0035B31993